MGAMDFDPELARRATGAVSDDELLALPSAQPVAPVAVAESTAAAPAPEYLDRNQSSGALLADADAAKNRLLDNATAQGENAAAMHEDLAATQGEDTAAQQTRLGKVDARTDKHREEADAYVSKARAHVEEMEASLAEGPPKGALEIVMNILAAAVGRGEGGGAIARDIGAWIKGGGAKEWQSKIAAHGELAKAFEGLSHDRDAHSESDIRQQSGLAAAQTAMYSSALKQISETAQSESVRLDAAEARDKLLNGYAENAFAMKSAQEAAQSKGAAAGKRSAREAEIYKALTVIQDPEQRAIVAGQFGKLGQTVLQDIQRSDANVAQLGATAATTAKALAGEAGPGQQVVTVNGVPHVATNAVEKGVLGKLQEKSTMLGEIKSDLNRLLAIRTKEDGNLVMSDKDNERDSEFLLAGLTDKLSNYYGGGAAGEAAAQRTLSAIPNPTDYSWRGDPKAAYKHAAKSLEADLQAGLRGAGFVPQGGPVAQVQPAGGPAPKPLAPPPIVSAAFQPEPKVSMVNPDTGETRMVLPRLVQEYGKLGFVRGRGMAQPVASADTAPLVDRQSREGGL